KKIDQKYLGVFQKLQPLVPLVSMDTLNRYVPSPNFAPSPEHLTALWDTLSQFIVHCLNAQPAACGPSHPHQLDQALAIASKIRLVGARDVAVPRHVGRTQVLGANEFPRPLARGTPIGHGRGPWRREDAIILDGKLQLKPFALVVRVDGQSPVTSVGNVRVLLQAPLLSLSGGFRFDQPITLDDVQSRGLGRSVKIDHGERPDPDPYGVDHQRV